MVLGGLSMGGRLLRSARWLGPAVATVLLAALLVVVPFAPPAAAVDTVSVTKDAPGEVLVGEPATFTIRASSPATNADALFNGSIRDVLPVGFRYVPGSTSPASAGDPQIVTTEVEVEPGVVEPQQTLLWINLGDLQVNSSFSLSFQAEPADPDDYPVGSTFTNAAGGYASSDPRLVPRFDDTGAPILTSNVVFDETEPTTTQVTALTVTKGEPSPEGELLRGVHDQTTVYTLSVRNNDLFATETVSLVDYLPAGLEFLGCGGVDNTPVDSPATVGGREDPDAPSLAGAPTPPDVPSRDEVETVANPTGPDVPPGVSGVVTTVRWTLGDLAPGEEVTIRYAAGVPLRENTVTFASGTTPTPQSLGQAANLDNNTGPSTREGATEQSLTNVARAAGTYTGPVEPGTSTEVADTVALGRSVEDVALTKTADQQVFSIGEVVLYSFEVRVSEYVDGSGITITDEVPNGLCPLSSDTNFVDGQPEECDPRAGADPIGADYSSVTQNPDGTFTVVFTDLQVSANGTAQVVFGALKRSTYTGGGVAGAPPVSGDSFTNTASLAGTTTPIVTDPPGGTGETGAQQVEDSSEATLATRGLQITKRIQPRTIGQDCSAGGYEADPAPDDPDFFFRQGDRVCFELEVRFPSGIGARNPVVTDFLPAGTAYEPLSQFQPEPLGVPVEFNETASANGTDNPTWVLGEVIDGERFVPPGAVFRVRLAAIVQRAADGEAVDLTGNLMKLRTENTAGQGVSFRDDVPLSIAPAPDVTIVKGVASVDRADGLDVLDPTPPDRPGQDVDDVEVRQTDEVTYRIDVTNTGDEATSNDVSVRGWQVWDVLPPGITCADVVPGSISGTGDVGSRLGVCTNPGEDDHPTFAGQDSRSAIRWQASDGVFADPPPLGDGSLIDTGETRTLSYSVRIPDEVSVSTVFDNTAHVRSFNAFTNEFGGTTTFFPADNVDTTVPPTDYSAPVARDPSSVFLPDAALVKQVAATSVAESNNNNTANGDAPADQGQATNGEQVTYRIGVTVPAQTTVYRGEITDSGAPGLSFVSASAAFSADGSSPASDPLPSGFALDAATGTLTFPQTYTNATDTDQLVQVTVIAVVDPTTGGHNSVRTNTATFSAAADPAGSTPLPELTDTAGVQVVFPNPRLTKTNEADPPIDAGSIVTYRLRVSNAVNRPPLHDAVVVDCLPDGLTFVEFTAVPTGTTSTEPGDGTNGCPVDSTRIEWTLSTPLEARQAFEAFYTATVDDTVLGGVSYTNTAELVGSTLADGANDDTVERVLTRGDASTVTIASPSITKSVSPPSLTFGERATFVLETLLPREINFFDVAVIDELPAGFDPTSVQTTSIECSTPDGSPCQLTGSLVSLPAAPGPAGTALIGWSLGDSVITEQDETVRIEYTALLSDPTAPPSLGLGDERTNRARTAWNITDGDPPPSAGADFDLFSAPANATVTIEEPELTVTKAVSDQTPGPAEPFTYTITVTNASDEFVSDAFDLEVVDTVPVGVVVTDVDQGGLSTPGTPAEQGGGTVTWSLPGPVAPGESVTLTYQAVLGPSPTLDGSPLTNTVVVEDYASQPTGAEGRRTYPDRDPSATATVTPQFPALTVTKTTPDGPLAFIDGQFRWQIAVTNSGTSPLIGVVGTDVLPPNWQYVPGSFVFSLGGEAIPGEPIVSSQTDADGNVTQTVQTGTPVDLAPGQTATATFLAVPLDSGDRSVVTLPGVGSDVAHTNTVSATGTDASGATENATGPYEGSATADARIDSADMSIEKTPDPGFPVAGQEFTWTLTVTNNGPDDARGFVQVVDDLPTDPDAPETDPVFVSADGAGWVCTSVADRVVCDRDMVNPDGSDRPFDAGATETIEVTVAIPADVPDATEYLNEVEVSSRTYDPDLDNNADDATATVQARADLQVVKALSGGLVAGQRATYTLDVRNNGPSLALGPLVVTDDLPAGVGLVSASGAGWSCDDPADVPPGGVVACTRAADLPPNTPAGQITLVVSIPAEQTAPVLNTARVCVDETGSPDGLPEDVCPVVDPILGNNTSSVSTPPTTLADLSLEKLREPADAELVAGEEGTYRFLVANAGPSDAQPDVTITDLLPEGISLVADPTDVTTSQGVWTCTTEPAGDRFDLTCTLDRSLPAGAQTTLDLPVAISASLPAGAVVENTATVTSPTTDPDESNNTDSDSTDSSALADLVIEKSHEPEPAIAGGGVTFTLAVRNDGPSDAGVPVTVTDAVPAAFTVVSAQGSDATYAWDCDTAAVPLTCTLTDPGTGDPIALAALTEAPPITVVATVDPGAGPATIRNTATVDSSTSDPDPGSNTSSDDVTIVDVADITVVKQTVGPDPVLAGETTSFTLQVSNAGPSVADDVSLTDSLPDGLVVQSVDAPSPWTCQVTDQSVECQLDELPPGDAPLITLTAGVLDDVLDGSTLQNLATVATSTDQGENTRPDTDTASVGVIAEADLAVQKLLVPPTSECDDVCAGEPVDFTIAVTNNGPSTAQPSVRVTDTLPPGFTATGTSDPAGAWECVFGPANPTGQEVACVLVGGDPAADLPLGPVDPDVPGSGEAPLLTVSTLASSDATLGTATNSVVVASPTTDRVTGNNTDTADVVVQGQADLAITKTHAPEPATAGEPVTVTLTVTNDGPSDAAATADDPLVVVDVLPDGLSFVSADSPDGWVCTDGPAGTVTCTDAEVLPAGATETITLVVLVDPAAGPRPDSDPIVNTAQVCPEGCLTPDPDQTNNTATDEITVVDVADVTIEKATTGDDPVLAGESTEFTLTVTNAGPSTADDVSVTDTTPTGQEPVSASGDGWTCGRPAGQQITCDLDAPLPPGQSRTIVVLVDVDPDAPVGPATNSAVVTTSTPQGENALPDEASSDVEVIAEADLAITKALSGDLIAGENATYTLDVRNLGPSTSRADVLVTDTVPAGSTFVSAAGEGWSCTEADGTVTCTLAGDLPAQASAGQITLVVAIPSSQTTDVVNTAQVTSTGTVDPNPDNDTATVTTPPVVEADLLLEKAAASDFIPGAQATYAFDVLNAGPSDAVGPLTLTDDLPPGVVLVEVDDPADGWACAGTPTDPPPTDSQAVTCSRSTGLPADEQTSFSITVALDPSLGLGTEEVELVNEATVTSPTIDPNLENNTNGDRTTAPPEADLAISKSHSPEPVVAGDDIVVTLQVVNNGASTAAADVVVTDALPDAFAFGSFGTTSGWDCTHDGSARGGLVTCVLGDPPVDLLPTDVADGPPPIQVVVTVDPSAGPASVTNRASTSSLTPDPDLTNNVAEDTVTIVDLADVTIAKTTTGDDPVRAGETTQFTLAVSNAGPSDADAVVVTDTAPSGMTIEAIEAPAPWDCTGVGGRDLVCTYDGSLPPGDAPAIVITVREATGTPDGTVLTNTATVGTSTPQGENLLPDEDSSQVTVRAEADLVLTKDTVEPTGLCAPAACAGEDVAFTLTVTNDGPSDAVASVTVVDTLPDGLTPIAGSGSADGRSWDCAVSGQDVTCTLVSTAAGSPVPLVAGATAPTLTVTATVGSDVDTGTAVINSATVTSPTVDPDETTNTATSGVDIETQADLAITKSHAPEPATAGEPVTVTLTVTNDGPSDAAATADDPLVVVDVLPDGLSLVSADSPDGWVCADGPAGTVTCTDAQVLPAGATETITLVVLVDPAAGPRPDSDPIVNIAQVCPEGCLTPDPDQTNNTATDEITVVDVADIIVTKATTGADPVLAGQTTEFTVTVSNAGPSTADDVTLTDRLPAGLAFIPSQLPSGEGWTCAAPDGRQITCALDDPLPPTGVGGASPAVLTVPVRVLPGVLDGTTLLNQATGATSTPGDIPLNNTATSPVLVRAAADLVLAKAYDGGPVLAGEQGQFTITVTNDGPSDAQPVIEVVDTLPPLLSFVAASDGWTCTADPQSPSPEQGQTVTCVDDSGVPLPPGGQLTLTLDVLVDPSAPAEPLTNTATVCPEGITDQVRAEGGLLALQQQTTCPTTDPDRANNTGEAELPVEQLVDLGITKTHEGDARVGDPLTYTLEVTNAGPSTATAVTVTDVLPPGLSKPVVLGIDGAPWSCTAGEPTADGTPLTCSLADPLRPGATTAFEVTVTVGPEAYPEVTNTAAVSTQTPESTDPGELPDSASETVQVPALVDLVVTKSHQGDFTVGEPGEFVLTVTNLGPTPDPGPVTVSDTLPVGLEPQRAAGPGWDCTVSGQQVTCVDADGLAVDETTEITVVVDVFAEAVPSVRNTATVSSPSEDVDPASNASTDEVRVVNPAVPPSEPDGGLPATGASLPELGALTAALVALGAVLLVAATRLRRRVQGV